MKFIYCLLILLHATIGSIAQTRFIHVFVALCDNKNQGIVKVPAKIGNGQDPANNLYWGARYGVKTYFKNQQDWKLIKTEKNPSPGILERAYFSYTTFNTLLIADAYDGACIKQCTIDYLKAAAGKQDNFIDTSAQGKVITSEINTHLICYIGHNGLMDFELETFPKEQGYFKCETILLACASRGYFKEAIAQSGATPLLWTTNLMCPEAYTLKAAIDGWLLSESPKSIQHRAAQAYASYQHCTLQSALKLLVTGW